MNNELLELLTQFKQDSTQILVQHYKNKKVYKVLSVGEHTTTHQRFVVYQSVSYPQDNQVWIRPIEEFCDILIIDETSINRFNLI